MTSFNAIQRHALLYSLTEYDNFFRCHIMICEALIILISFTIFNFFYYFKL